MRCTTVKFIDIAMSMNVHTFIIWEFIRRYGYNEGVTKDKYGRGYVSSAKCRGWIDKLAQYVKEQDFSYKQEINKRQYLFRDPDRLAEEKRQIFYTRSSVRRDAGLAVAGGRKRDAGTGVS